MPLDVDVLDADIAFMITDLPAADGSVLKATINEGDAIECSRNILSEDKLLVLQGAESRYRFSIHLQKSLFVGDIPEVDDDVVLSDIDDEVFVVLAVDTDPADQLLRLDLGQDTTEIPPR